MQKQVFLAGFDSEGGAMQHRDFAVSTITLFYNGNVIKYCFILEHFLQIIHKYILTLLKTQPMTKVYKVKSISPL